MGLLSLSNLEICIKKPEFSDFKGLKSQIVSKFYLGLLNAYNFMYFDRNISENKDGKKMRAVICLGLYKGEFYFISAKTFPIIA
jgi:hypothetical protein